MQAQTPYQPTKYSQASRKATAERMRARKIEKASHDAYKATQRARDLTDVLVQHLADAGRPW